MRTDNPFAGVGTVVKGQRFIGREQEIHRIHEKLLGRGDFGSLAIIGMPRIGKSSLAHQALIHNRKSELASLRGIVVYMDVSTITASDTFFDGIVRRVEAGLAERQL